MSDSGLHGNKHNSYWYGVQYQDRQTAFVSWYGPVEMILPLPPAISFPLVRTTPLGQSVYSDIALHISNYYIITLNIHIKLILTADSLSRIMKSPSCANFLRSSSHSWRVILP